MIKLDKNFKEILDSEISCENKPKKSINGNHPLNFNTNEEEKSIALIFNDSASYFLDGENKSNTKTTTRSEFLFQKDDKKIDDTNSIKDFHLFKSEEKEEIKKVGKKNEFNMPLQVNKLENEKKKNL